MRQLENVNIEQLCRACFEVCDEFKMLAEDSPDFGKLTLGDVFNQVVKIETKENPITSPNRICIDCVKELNVAYNFIQKSLQNHDRLIEFFKNAGLKQPDCLSEIPIDIPIEVTTAACSLMKVEAEVLNEYDDNSAQEFDRSPPASEPDEPPLKKEKEINELQCTFCDRQFKRVKSLEKHENKHREEMSEKEKVEGESGTLLCDGCGFICKSRTELKAHLEKEHKDGETKERRKTRSKATSQTESTKIKPPKNRFQCDSCSKTFAWRKDLYRHQRYHEPNSDKFPCPHCDRQFLRKDKLSSHLLVHFAGLNNAHTLKSYQYFAHSLYSEKRFRQIKCMICGSESFTNVPQLREHIAHHNNLEAVEDFANSQFVERFFPNMDLKEVYTVLKKQIGQGEFERFYSIVNTNCYELGLSDSDESDVETKKSYKCEVCERTLDRKYKMMAHQAYEHTLDECPYECETCELKFMCKEIFESHRKYHCGNPDKVFNCQLCPGRFVWPQNMQNHKCKKKSLKHKENNKCDVCYKVLDSSADLKTHKQTHDSERKTYDCAVCGEKFFRYESMRIHMDTHNKNEKLLRKISCMLCNAEFTSMSSLKPHLLKHAEEDRTDEELKKSEFARVFYPNAEVSEISSAIKKCFSEERYGQFFVGINKFGLEMTLSDSDSEDGEQSDMNAVRKFNCILCTGDYRKRDMLKHQYVEHDNFTVDFPHKCDICGDGFVCEELLRRHSKLPCLNSDRDTCSKCGCIFAWKHNMAAHNCQANEKEDDVKRCEVCGKKFNWLKDLHRHKRSHVPDNRKFECLLCGKKFSRKDNMRSHLKIHNTDYKVRTEPMLKWKEQDENLCRPHGRKIIQCKICLSIHNSIRDLSTHLMKHKDRATLKQKPMEVREISTILYNKPMDLRTLSKEICQDLTDGKNSHFYSITNEAGYELSLADSETATDMDADDDEEDCDMRRGYTCMLCKKVFNRKFKVFEHQRTDHSWDQLPLKCEFCSARFVCESIYELHLKNECGNSEKQHKCKVCPLKFRWKENLKHHEKYVHDKTRAFPKRYQCGVCNRSFLWRKDMLRHKQTHQTTEEKFECTWCFRVFMRRDNLKVHMKVHQNATHLLLPDIYYLARPNSTKLVLCKLCDERPKTVHELLQHIQSAHLNSPELQGTVPGPESYSITNSLGYEMDIQDSETEGEEPTEKYSCDLCQTRFNRRFKLLQHQQSLHYSDDIPHRCEHCNFKCVSEPVLAYHKRTQCLNEVKKFQCSKCTMRFMWQENLENHESLIHDRSRTYTCNICKRDFATRHDLKNHSECNPPVEEKIFECNLCTRKYNRKDRLMKHVKVHSEKYKEQRAQAKSVVSTDKKFLCAFCGKEVSSSSNLVIHMRRHTGEKPFKCEFCNKGFPRSSDLCCHRRTHTGEKPHKCTVCDKAFSRSYKLQTHMRIHSGEKPYKCTFCDKGFIQSNDLTLHVRRHTGERPYVCEKCGESFIQGTALRNHRRMRGHFPT